MNTNTASLDKTIDIIEEIKELGEYRDVRLLDDGSIIAIGELMFTRAIYMDVNLYGWERRFCFQDRALADAEFKKLQTGEEEPVGWIARR
jgi:hypothetical protein